MTPHTEEAEKNKRIVHLWNQGYTQGHIAWYFDMSKRSIMEVLIKNHDELTREIKKTMKPYNEKPDKAPKWNGTHPAGVPLILDTYETCINYGMSGKAAIYALTKLSISTEDKSAFLCVRFPVDPKGFILVGYFSPEDEVTEIFFGGRTIDEAVRKLAINQIRAADNIKL